MAKPRPSSKPPVYGPPEKRNWWVTALLWLFVIAGIAGIGWMIWHDPETKPLICRSDVPSSLLSFGTCTEQ